MAPACLWIVSGPVGVAKEDADIAHWLKGLAPSTELRKWFGHDPDKWPEFRERYLKELAADDASEDLAALKQLREDHDRITLVFAAKDTALCRYLPVPVSGRFRAGVFWSGSSSIISVSEGPGSYCHAPISAPDPRTSVPPTSATISSTMKP